MDKGPYSLTREQALEAVVEAIPEQDFIVSTTGKTSRELFEIRERFGQDHSHDFLTVGSMGHASSIAYGFAVGAPEKRHWCIDGDGAMLMHLGALPIIASQQLPNYRYVVNVNGAHESVGGQPTIAFQLDVPALLKACGFTSVLTAETSAEIGEAVEKMACSSEAVALVLYTEQGSRDDLGRPTTTPVQNKEAIMKEIAS